MTIDLIDASKGDAITLPYARQHGAPFDPPLGLDTLRETAPITPLRYADGTVGWLITAHSMARRVLGTNSFVRSFASPLPGEYDDAFVPEEHPGVFILLDPPDHTKFRRVMAGDFAPRKLAELRPFIEGVVSDRLDVMTEMGAPADFYQTVALAVPSLVIAKILGVPADLQDDFNRYAAEIIKWDSPAETIKAAIQSMDDLCEDVARSKRQHPADDVFTRMIESGVMTDREIGGAGGLLLTAGHETTASMMSLGLLALMKNRTQFELLRTDPDLAKSAVEEILRYATIFQPGVRAKATENVEIDGHVIHAGDHVLVSLSAANRDESKFGDTADELDITRNAMGHLAFSHGVHVCLGQHLARLELSVALPAIVQRFPNIRLAGEEGDLEFTELTEIYGTHHMPVRW